MARANLHVDPMVEAQALELAKALQDQAGDWPAGPGPIHTIYSSFCGKGTARLSFSAGGRLPPHAQQKKN